MSTYLSPLFRKPRPSRCDGMGADLATPLHHDCLCYWGATGALNTITDCPCHARASAYVLKQSAPSELIMAIREVMQGRSYVTPLVTGGLVGSLLHADEREPFHELTPRQREVLQLLAEGNSMKQVAAVLNLTP